MLPAGVRGPRWSDGAREWAEERARLEGYWYVHPANEPHILAGAGSVSLEVMEVLAAVDGILVPIGGGSGGSGHCPGGQAHRPGRRRPR